MVTVINRETGAIRFSVHTPNYSETDWAINPEGLDDVADVPAHYRIVEGNAVREATQKEKDTIDEKRLPIIKAGQIINYCDMIRDRLVISADKSAGELRADITQFGSELNRVIKLVKDAKDLQKLREITTTLDMEIVG